MLMIILVGTPTLIIANHSTQDNLQVMIVLLVADLGTMAQVVRETGLCLRRRLAPVISMAAHHEGLLAEERTDGTM